MNDYLCLEGINSERSPVVVESPFPAVDIPDVLIAPPRAMLDAIWLSVERFERDELLRYVAFIDPLIEHNAVIVQLCTSRDELETLLAIGLIWRGEAACALDLASTVLARSAAPRFRLVLLIVIRYACWKMRRLDMFNKLSMTRLYHGRLGMQVLKIINLSIEAAAEAEQLRLKLAELYARQALELAEAVLRRNANVALLPRCVLATVVYEMGGLKEAHALIRGMDAAIDQYGCVDTTLLGITVASRIAIANDQPKQAMLVIRKGLEVSQQRGWSQLTAHFAEQEITLLIKEGNLLLAIGMLARALHREPSDMQLSLPIDETEWPLEAARLRVMFASGDYAGAADGFTRLSCWLNEQNQASLAVRFAALAAASLFRGAHQEDACAGLLKALELGAAAGLFRTFVDELALIAPCLRRVRATMKSRLGHLNAYINDILAPHSARHPVMEDDAMQEGTRILSRREVVVLHWISKGYSNKSIARELYIAPETVKSHIKRISLKLSTKTRAQAVAHGKSLGII